MADFPFVDRDGQIFYYSTDEAKTSEVVYVIIKKENEVLCLKNEEDMMYVLPSHNDVFLTIKPSVSFTTLSYVIKHNEPVKERQTYEVYDVGCAELGDMPLEWLSIDKILFGGIYFDATQRNGIKNLLVRGG